MIASAENMFNIKSLAASFTSPPCNHKLALRNPPACEVSSLYFLINAAVLCNKLAARRRPQNRPAPWLDSHSRPPVCRIHMLRVFIWKLIHVNRFCFREISSTWSHFAKSPKSMQVPRRRKKAPVENASLDCLLPRENDQESTFSWIS